MNSFLMKVITSEDVCAVWEKKKKNLLACECMGHKLKTNPPHKIKTRSLKQIKRFPLRTVSAHLDQKTIIVLGETFTAGQPLL